MEIESLTGIFADSLGLKGNLTSCEHELKELMRQIDLMVTAKKAEWENHLHAVQIQLEKRNKEVGFVRTQLEQKNQEVQRLQHRLDEMELAQNDGISDYEQKVMYLKEEVDNLKYEHEKIQKKSEKQAFQVEKERDQLSLELKSRDAEVQRLKERLEEYKSNVLEWEGARQAWEERIRGLENQKKALLEKSDIAQQQILSYQSQLNKRRNMLENIEHDRQREIKDLETQLKRTEEVSESKEEAIMELKDSLDSALSASKQQASEITQLQEDLRVALDAIQQLEEEKLHLLMELQSRDGLIQAAEEDQLKHADDIMKLEQSLTLKDEVIRKFEGANARTENMELKRLKEDMRTSKMEVQSHIDSEAFLKEELDHTAQKLDACNKSNAKLQAQLKKKEEEIKITEEDIKHLIAERNRLQERIYSLEEGHAGALNGMRSEVDSLASELHKRDTSVADVSEKIQRMEKELRQSTNQYDRCAAELQVTNAQLEALRIENKHLRDAARDQLDMSDVYQGNMEFIARLEADNRELRMDVVSLREQLSAVEISQQDRLRSALKKSQNTMDDMKQSEFRRHSELQSEAERKLVAQEAQLESTIRKYEAQLHLLKTENERLKMSQSRGTVTQLAYMPLPNDTVVVSEDVPKRAQDISHTSASDYTDTEALTYADLGLPPVVSETEIFRCVTITPAQDYSIMFGESLAVMLGFGTSLSNITKKTSAPYVINIEESSLTSLYVYSDVIEPQILGDNMVPLLRVINVAGIDGETVSRTFQGPSFFSVSRKSIDRIQVNIKDDTGQNVLFEASPRPGTNCADFETPSSPHCRPLNITSKPSETRTRSTGVASAKGMANSSSISWKCSILDVSVVTCRRAASSFENPQKSSTPRGSRRTSLTADFVAEENRREKELERILDGRIADLRANTEYIIHKYS